jgi:hypothetical protein
VVLELGIVSAEVTWFCVLLSAAIAPVIAPKAKRSVLNFMIEVSRWECWKCDVVCGTQGCNVTTIGVNLYT